MRAAVPLILAVLAAASSVMARDPHLQEDHLQELDEGRDFGEPHSDDFNFRGNGGRLREDSNDGFFPQGIISLPRPSGFSSLADFEFPSLQPSSSEYDLYRDVLNNSISINDSVTADSHLTVDPAALGPKAPPPDSTHPITLPSSYSSYFSAVNDTSVKSNDTLVKSNDIPVKSNDIPVKSNDNPVKPIREFQRPRPNRPSRFNRPRPNRRPNRFKDQRFNGQRFNDQRFNDQRFNDQRLNEQRFNGQADVGPPPTRGVNRETGPGTGQGVGGGFRGNGAVNEPGVMGFMKSLRRLVRTFI